MNNAKLTIGTASCFILCMGCAILCDNELRQYKTGEQLICPISFTISINICSALLWCGLCHCINNDSNDSDGSHAPTTSNVNYMAV